MPSDRSTTAERVAEALRHRITDGDLRPGAQPVGGAPRRRPRRLPQHAARGVPPAGPRRAARAPPAPRGVRRHPRAGRPRRPLPAAAPRRVRRGARRQRPRRGRARAGRRRGRRRRRRGRGRRLDGGRHREHALPPAARAGWPAAHAPTP
nr:hypothetical protein [Angustibacter aerolatus]